MKGILFNEYGDLYRCSFDDDKRSGKPSIMLITQGLPVKRLEEFDNDQDLSGLNYRLLCLNGEPASSLTVAMLLGTVMANPVGYVDDDIEEWNCPYGFRLANPEDKEKLYPIYNFRLL